VELVSIQDHLLVFAWLDQGAVDFKFLVSAHGCKENKKSQ
jgi:hypothetical protein